MIQLFLKRVAFASCLFGTALLAATPEVQQGPSSPGATVVAQWKDNKKGVFLMYFDDSIPSDVRTVVPELQKHRMVATFYVNPGGAAWRVYRQDWEKNIPATGVAVYGNHTMTHQGCKDLINAEQEIGPVNDIIEHAFPSNKKRLISYGQPGVPPGKWNITPQQLAGLLEKYHLILRPHSNSAVTGCKDANSILALADKAIATGTEQDILFHGVGGDWIVFDTGEFIKVLDGLSQRRDALWITDHISEYQYDTERKTATVQLTAATDHEIQLNLKSDADKNLFDLPLTLITKVPDSWEKCEVGQGDMKKTVAPTGGRLLYDAAPNGGLISIERISR